DAVRVDELFGKLDARAEADRHDRLLLVISTGVFLDRSRNAEIRLAVRHARDLKSDHSRREKSGEDVPFGTRAGEAREANTRCGEALGNISSDVDADEVKGNPFISFSLHRGEPMAHLFEPHAETTAEHIEVVTFAARRFDEW